MRGFCSVVSALAAGTLLAAGTPGGFSRKPTATKAGDQVRIEFAVAAPTDVEVAVLDAKGQVVRHLAAGVLGGANPPPAPLAPGLSQTLLWDGKDDVGQPVLDVANPQATAPVALSPSGRGEGEGPPSSPSRTVSPSPSPLPGRERDKRGGPFRARVRAGTGVKFGRVIGGSPYTGAVGMTPYRAPLNGLVTGDDGALYVLMMSDIHSHGNSGFWPWHLRRFDREGGYLKTVLPYPPSTDPAKTSGMTLLSTPNGAFTPANQNSLYPVFTVLGDEILPRMAEGQVVFVNSRDRVVNFFKVDGSNALRTVPMWSAKAGLVCAYFLSIQAAISPDGRYAYYSNVAGVPYDPKSPAEINEKWPQGRIYRQDLSQPGSDPVPFFDLTLPPFDPKAKDAWVPNAWNKKTAAGALDVDARGNLLICDLATQAVVEVSPEGKQVSVTKVPWPERVLASRKRDTLYVISKKFVDKHGGEGPPTLYKIAGRGEKAFVAERWPLRGVVGGAMTLDEHDGSRVLWIGGGRGLLRIWDQGEALVLAQDTFLNRDPNAIQFVGYMDVDPEADLVYVTASGSSVWRFKGETGEGGPIKLKAVDLAVGPGGMVYTWGVAGGYHGPIGRFTRDLEPAPLAATGTHTYGALSGRAGRGSSVCGMDVDVRGRVFVTDGSNACHVRAYGPDGQLVAFDQSIRMGGEKGQVEIPAAIDSVSGYGGSIRTDPAGNLYLLQQGVPKGFSAPAGYDRDPAYRATAGTILKFGPAGGRRKTPVDSGGRGGDPLGFEGVLAMYPDCGPISGWRCDGSCACTKPRFDVDPFGRLYIPNAITFKVSVRDNAGNEILRFGHYGNFDCQGAGSGEPKPEIPLGWPITVGASDRFIYIGDCLNHRVVRVDKTFAAEGTCKVE